MKRKIAVVTLMAIPLFALADNIIRTQAPIRFIESSVSIEEWVEADPLYGAWVNTGSPTGCGQWLPSAASVDMNVQVTQNMTCNQEQVRSVQPRQQLKGTETYRESGLAYQEFQTIQSQSERVVNGSIARSCLMHKQYAGATSNGVYSIKIADRDVNVMCDMTGGGWTIVGRGYQGAVSTWASSRNAVNPSAVPGASSNVTARLSDADINEIPKTAFKVVTTGYNNTRYFKGSCMYNSLKQTSGDCAISYADESWNSPRGNGLAGVGSGGLCDNRTSVSGDGLYVNTSEHNNPTHGWAAGNGTTNTYIGSGTAGTLISLYIYVK